MIYCVAVIGLSLYGSDRVKAFLKHVPDNLL